MGNIIFAAFYPSLSLGIILLTKIMFSMLSDSSPALKVLKVKLNNRENIENVIFSVEVREYEEKWVKFMG
jgi:hypothetical protein